MAAMILTDLPISRMFCLLVPFAAWPIQDRCDIVELNHLHDGKGCHRFSQVIFWEWCPTHERHAVIAWRMWKEDNPWGFGDGKTFLWWEAGRLRQMRYKEFRETVTQYDPEQRDLLFHPKENRRGLLPP